MWHGFTGDSARTFPVGEISDEAKKLMRICRKKKEITVAQKIGVLKKDDFRAFLPLVQSIVPNHPHIPTLTEMMRLNVGCFSKPFAQWTLEKSPFKKVATYNEYLHLAQEMMERLEE